jgi:DNA-binding SARP family transcriptional activator
MRKHSYPDSGTVVHLFGGPFITIDGRRCDVPRGSKRVLAFVALRNGRLERRYAAGALWPDADETRAAGNLRSALWRLRGAGADVIDADKWGVALRDDVVIDARVTYDWAARVISGEVDGDDLSTRWVSVGALDLLPGWYDDWAVTERDRLRQRYLHALEILSPLLSLRGRHADAVEVAMVAAQADPLRESAHRALIEAHVAEGNLSEARRDFIAYRDLVRRELCVEPGRELCALVGAAPPR